MNEHTSIINEAFIEVISGKIDAQDKKIASIEEVMKNIPDNTALIQQLISTVKGLQDEVKNSRFPAEKLDSFSARMDIAISQLKQPVANKVLHHHHVPKIIRILAGLFITLAVVCSGWYMTANKLDSYIANDTKYRQLRLDTAQRDIHTSLR